MDAPEGNRIGRTIWTVWGYLSGAVARYLRPEATDEGNQSVRSRADDIDLKSAANKINRNVKANNSEKEEKKYNQNDESTAEVKCSPPEVRVQVASVQWENTDVVKDKNVELHVDTARKQTFHCAVWSAETSHEENISGDSESQGCKTGVHVDKETVSSDEVQAERVNASCKKSVTVQELDKTGQIEQKDGDNEESDQKHEDEKCSKKTEDPDNAGATVQSELYGQDVEQEIVINMMDRGETESIGGFKHADEHLIDEMEKNIVDLKDLEKTETDEDQRSQSQVQDLLPDLDYSTEQDTTKSELLESVETQQRVSKEISEKYVSNNETELKMTSVLDEIYETVTTSKDILLLDSKPDTLENTSETGTGSPVVAIKTEGIFSDLIVCEFPGESRKGPETALGETALGCFEEVKTNLHELQSLAEEQTETETFVACSVEHPETQKAVEIEQDIETPIESLDATESQTHQELDETKFSLKEQVELRTELIVETTEIKTSSEDEEEEPFETQSQRNVTLQTHELLEFTERECQSSQETMDTFSESLGNSNISEITGTAKIEHVAEDQTDVKPVLTRTLSTAESLEETLDLQSESERCIEEQEPLDTDLRKSALEYVEEITNQVLKEMIEMEMVQETETLVGLSTEELGDAEYQGPEKCVSAGAFVLEEERKLLGETMGSMVEMEMETASREVAQQNELHIISPECETEADGHHEHQTFPGIDRGGSISCDTERDTHVENEAVSSNEGQAERVYANSECKESETALELDETGQTEQKDGNNEECDQNHEDEKCERKKEDADNTEATVQSELYGQDVEQEIVINMMDSGETESIGGFRHADEHLIDEKEKNIVDQNDHEKTETDEDQRPELQVPADAFVLEEGRKLLGETMDSKIELEVENASSEVVKQNEQHISSPECETTGADGHHEQQTYLCAGTDCGGSISCDTERDTHVENEAVSSDEGQAERVYANSECKESEMAQELDETGQIEQKDGNDEECDRNHEDEKCERKKEDADNTEATVQSELYGQDVEQETVINMMDSGETESIGGFGHADEHLIDEKEKYIVDQNDHEKTETDEDQRPELQMPSDAFVLEEGRKLLGETMDSKIELEVENASSEVVKQNEQHISSPECETTGADGHHEQQTYLCAGTDCGGSISCDTERDTHVENEAVSSDEGQAERVYANSECKESEMALELDETGQIEQKDGNDEECDQNHEDEKCERKKEDADNTEATVQSELYGQDVEQETVINMMDSGETESIGGFGHADEHLIDEKEKNIVDQNDREKTETDEDQRPELQVPADAFVLEEGRKLLGETMDSKIELEVENASSEVVKQNEQHISSPECETTEADGHHEQQTYLCAGTDCGGSISCDTERDTHVENEAVSSDEGQAERVYADSECKESEMALELDETGQTEQKDGNDEECDQNHEDEKCERKKEDADNTEATVQSELYGQDVEQETVINMMDSGETESIGGFRHADEKETNIFDQNVHKKEIEDQRPELQVPADAFVLEEGRKLLGETMDSKIELEVENASSEVVKQNELQSSPECETTEADGRHEQIQKVIAGETELRSHEDLMEISRPGMKRGFDRVSKDLPVAKTEGKYDLDLQAFEDSSLDFTVQKSRIAVKNPLVRPPKDPRKLLYMVSVEPLPPQPPACAQKAAVSVPSKGVIGFKLPGLGAGLPVLRKTEFGKKAREEGEAERTLHPQQKAAAVTEDSVKQEQASAKPKWTPPKHPGMGGPLMMAELKNKLKKPKE